jgi:C-3',4' desaturase CrtD
MDCEVVVVGGGIGGLTVAALLASRGVSVCVLERERQVGGCAAAFEKFDYRFDPGYGLFTGWEPGGIHERVFSELRVEPPNASACDPAYVVRLPDASEIKLVRDQTLFEMELRQGFPECADEAIEFYRETTRLGAATRSALRKTRDLLSQPKARRAYSLFSRNRSASEILIYREHSAAQHLERVSNRFRRFVDVQLQTFAQGNGNEVSYLQAALSLSAPFEGIYALQGGAPALAERLAKSITQSGGKVRLNTPVLKLAYDASGGAMGVDLLSGETVSASQAIVSNLTLWDTYGKLIGLNRTPTEIRKQLNGLRGWGAYLLFLGVEENAGTDIPNHVLTLKDWQESAPYTPEDNQLVFAAAPARDGSAPAGKRAVTVHAFTEVDEWFTFHNDESEHDEKDQQMLEQCWNQLHAAMPELGSNIEVIDTATPRTFYDLTRRKLGMVGGVASRPELWRAGPNHETSLPNLFMVGDTSSGWGIEAITRFAWLLAAQLTR